jgi:hypothetical protein
MRWTVDESIRAVARDWDWTQDDAALLLEAIENVIEI